MFKRMEEPERTKLHCWDKNLVLDESIDDVRSDWD